MPIQDGRMPGWARVAALFALGGFIGRAIAGPQVGYALALLGAVIGLTVSWLFERLSAREQRLFDGFIAILSFIYLVIFVIVPVIQEYCPW